MDNSFLHGKKLLLVDDEPELLKMVTAILTDGGFRHLVTAKSVEEGTSAAEREKPDLAILDVMLPDGDGFSLMKGIRRQSDIPVIFLTGRRDPDSMIKVMPLNPSGYLLKNSKPEQIKQEIDAFFAKKK